MPEETPREYKKRIDKKWEKNEKNKEKLIKKIEGYELLDKGFKEQTKQEILANFEKNQKAELQGEKYTTIVAELGKIDKKYEELEDLKRQLEAKNIEKSKIEKEIKGSKLDGEDETTLNLQIENVRKLKERLETLRSEIEALEKDLKDREQEILEIEESYGEIVESNSENIQENDEETENQDEQVSGKLETLKEVHEQTIKELWSKDKIRKDIIKILDDGTGIDDELKERVKKEISEKFFEYYDEKQGSLSMKSARFVKNKLNNWRKKSEKERASLEGKEVETINRELKIYYGHNLFEEKNIKEIEETKSILKPYREVWNEKINLDYEIKEKIIKAAEKIPVKIDIDTEGSRLIELRLGDQIYKILDPILDNHSSIDDYSCMVNDSEQLISKNRRHVYSIGMIGDLDKWGNKPLREYVKQKQNEGLHLAMKNEIKKLLEILGNMAGLKDTASQIAMLMYLIGINGSYWLFGNNNRPNEGIRFNKTLSITECDDSWRLNILMINAIKDFIYK